MKFGLLFSGLCLASSLEKELIEKSKKSISANRVQHANAHYLRAGANQFASLWTRDFAYSVPGLLKGGFEQEVRQQLELLLEHFDSDSKLFPRSLDPIGTKNRVLLGLFTPLRSGRWDNALKAEYLGENNTPSVDGNALVILALVELLGHDPESTLLFSNRAKVEKALDYYLEQRNSDGLIHQPPFSDWQDSAKRDGAQALLNFQVLSALKKLAKLSGFLSKRHLKMLEELEEAIWTNFVDAKTLLIHDNTRLKRLSLDVNLFAQIDDTLFTKEQRSIAYENLKKHPLWHSFESAGQSSYPKYQGKDVSWTTKIVGLRHYHSETHWTWLMGLAAKAARQRGDQDEQQLLIEALFNAHLNEDYIAETLCSHQLIPKRTWIYRSEKPFTWGAAFILDALL